MSERTQQVCCGKPVKVLGNREYLAVTIPFMLSTVTQPLLGAVDTAAIGTLGDAAAIAGVSLGANLFNTLYWLFGFLRVSTTGHSAQLTGQDTALARGQSFFLPMLFAVVTAAAFLVFQAPLLAGYLALTAPEEAVAVCVRRYYQILIWGAPFVMVNYVMLGWLMGQKRVSASLFMQIGGNVVNMLLDLWFVCGLGLGIEGVAAATLISQGVSFLVGAGYMVRYGRFERVAWRQLWSRREVAAMLRENRDLLCRTVCLVIHNNVFAALSSRLGTDALAVNAILLQITSVQAYLFEGIANGSSVFAGKAAGTGSRELYRGVWVRTLQWGVAVALVMSLLCLAGGESLIRIFTVIPRILAAADRYLIYGVLYPLAAAGGLTIYGLYTGSSTTRPVFLSTLWALCACLPVSVLGVRFLGNDGLWAGYLTFYLGRSLGLWAYRGRLEAAFGKEIG